MDDFVLEYGLGKSLSVIVSSEVFLMLTIVPEDSLAVQALKRLENSELGLPAWVLEDYMKCYNLSVAEEFTVLANVETLLSFDVDYENIPSYGPKMVGLLWNPLVIEGVISTATLIRGGRLRTQVAWWFPCPERVIVDLARDPDYRIRALIAERVDVPVSVQKDLALDSVDEVSKAVTRNVSFEEDYRLLAGLRS